jgi:hypothetical protein
MVVLPSTGASHYHNCCIDGGTSPEYFGYTLVLQKNLLPTSSEYLMMKGASSAQISTNIYQTAWNHIPEDSYIHSHCQQNLISWNSRSLPGQPRDFNKYHPCYVATDIDLQVFSICEK